VCLPNRRKRQNINSQMAIPGTRKYNAISRYFMMLFIA
jgi:hypothetical protein